MEAGWQERQAAETALRNYLDDMPSMYLTESCISVSFHTYSEHRIHPWTSGKRQVKNVVPNNPGQKAVQLIHHPGLSH